MERKRRRLVTIAISIGATLVILAAAASGVFQLAVQAVPGYRADVEKYVREVTGKPVRIDALGLTWHYYYPSLELIGVALLSTDEKTVLLQAERLRLGFGLLRLVRGDARPDRLELQGLNLDARIDREGHVSVKGIESDMGAAGESLDALEPLTQFAMLRLARCRLNLRDERLGPDLYSFGIQEAELSRGLLGSDLSAEVALPAQVGDAARLDVAFTGGLLTPAQWSGAGSLELEGLVPSYLLAPYLERGVTLGASGMSLVARGRFAAGAFTSLDFDLSAGAVRATRPGHGAGLDSLAARVGIEFLQDGWRAELKKFAIESAAGHWPATGGELRATRDADGINRYEGRVDYLKLADLAPWLQLLKVPAGLASLDGATGELRELTFRVQGAGDDVRYGYRARFEQLGVPAQERPAGFAGAHGEVAGDERGGRAIVQDGPMTVSLPGVLATPTLPFDALEAELEWRHVDDGWRIALPQFRWALLGTRGQGHFDLRVPDDKSVSPAMNLSAAFSASDATRAKPLMPMHWSSGLRTWLDRAILSGDVPSAQLEIHGPLADFPYAEKQTGVWSLDIDARNLNLAYEPEWPSIEDFAASLHFRGNSLAIETRGGVVAGNPIQSATARFPDFRTGQLLVDGTVAGDTAKSYGFLAHSPLRETFRTLLEETAASGPSTVEVHLDIPVTQAHDTKVSGKVVLDGVQLDYHGLDEPIRDLRGTVTFEPGRIASDRVTGKLYELAIEGALVPQPGHGTLLNATFPLTVDATGKGASSLIPAWVRKRVTGTSKWQAKLPLAGDLPSILVLTTDFTGAEVKLPAPLAKPAGEAIPLAVTIGSAKDAPLRITAEFGNRLGADLRFARAAGAMAFDRGTIRLGSGPLIEPHEPGAILGGEVDTLDARAWAAELSGPSIEGQVQTIHRADLHVGRATWGRWALRDARWQWATTKEGWLLQLIGAGGIGEIRWASRDHGQLVARLDTAAFDELPASGDDEAGSVFDPGTAPLLDLDVRKAGVGNVDLGRVQLVTERVPGGQRLKQLSAAGGSIALKGDGEWRRRAGQSSGTFNAELSAKDIAGLLKAFGYSQSLDAKKSVFKAALGWAPSETGLDWAMAQGTVHLEFENGQLRAIDPGAGRVLGLVNLYALPRRLTLNFRDVVSSGLGFDKVQGDFELRDGNARTQNLAITGPSLRMDVKGRTGLAARDYDQTIDVYPDVSAGVTLGALALGGPIAGVLTLIAQQVLEKPLDQVTHLTYRVTGSWDNPQVERGAILGADSKKPERAPGPPSQKP